MSNIKDVCCKLVTVSNGVSLRVLVTLAYMKGRTDVRTENDVMAILPNFLPSMGYQYFLSYGDPRACAFGLLI